MVTLDHLFTWFNTDNFYFHHRDKTLGELGCNTLMPFLMKSHSEVDCNHECHYQRSYIFLSSSLRETGAHWDTGYNGTIYIGNSEKENVRETLLLSASCQEGIFTAVNLVRKKMSLSDLGCNLFPFFCNFYCT